MAKTAKFKAPRYIDHVGRARKLSHGALQAIMEEFAAGESVKTLADAYGVSTSLIRMVTYNTARRSDLDRIAQARAAQGN
jgi:hypothetical protein